MCDTLGFKREAPSGEEVSLKNYAISARALYIKISKGYIPKDRIEKNYYLSTKKRNLLLSNK